MPYQIARVICLPRSNGNTFIFNTVGSIRMRWGAALAGPIVPLYFHEVANSYPFLELSLSRISKH